MLFPLKYSLADTGEFSSLEGDNFGAAIWSSIESNVGIVCASLVHFKSLIARYAPEMLGMQRTAVSQGMRLPDSEGGGSLRTFGRSKMSNNKIGILTQLNLEEENTSQANMIHKPGERHPEGRSYEMEPWAEE
jgi:hypothetical protein